VAFGIDESLAVGSSLSLIIGTGAAGLARHARLGNVEPKSMLVLGGGAVAGAVLGTELHVYLRASLGLAGPVGFPVAMRGLYVVLLVVTGWLVLRGSAERGGRRSLLQRLPLPPRVDLPRASLTGVSLFGMSLVGVFVGVVSGLLGVGGGVLFMPILLLVVGLSAHQAVGTSLGVVLFASVAGTIKHGLAGLLRPGRVRGGGGGRGRSGRKAARPALTPGRFAGPDPDLGIAPRGIARLRYCPSPNIRSRSNRLYWRKAISVVVLSIPFTAIRSSVTSLANCSFSRTRATATRSYGPATL